MRPVRMRGGGGGGGFIPSVRSMAARLAIALVAASVLVELFGPQAKALTYLIPEAVLTQFRLWQPLSYVFLETNPMGVIFGGLILWSIGGTLEMSWGSRRLGFFAVGTTVAAGVLTVLLALLIPAARVFPFTGGTVMSTAVWVGFGLSHGRAQTNFWGMPVSGNVFAAFGVGYVLLNAIFGSWIGVIPELFALALTFLYVRAGSPRFLWLKFNSWRLQQRLKGRSKHLKVISRERNMPSDSDRYLH